MLCSLNGELFDVTIGNGCVSDKGFYIDSGLRDRIGESGLSVFGDRGYRGSAYVIAPNKKHVEMEENLEFPLQFHYRAVVETVFARVKMFAATSSTFKQSVALQKYVLLIVFKIVAKMIKENPLRSPDFFSEE